MCLVCSGFAKCAFFPFLSISCEAYTFLENGLENFRLCFPLTLSIFRFFTRSASLFDQGQTQDSAGRAFKKVGIVKANINLSILYIYIYFRRQNLDHEFDFGCQFFSKRKKILDVGVRELENCWADEFKVSKNRKTTIILKKF